MNTPLKKSVKNLFEGDTCFRIPEYQREYCWDEERCRSLWDDLVNESAQQEIFLGTFVTNTKKDGIDKYLDVVDGQQRVTTFYLIIRAGLQYLSEQIGDTSSHTDTIYDEEIWSDLRNELKGALWMKNSQQVRDSRLPRLVISSPFDSTKSDFSQIIASFYDKNSTYFKDLEKCDIKKKSLYIQNLYYFYKNFKEIGVQKTFTALNKILDRFLVLHLNCDDEEEALIVFDTLNNRGMQLKDADIFKSHLYKSNKSQEERDAFVSSWNTILNQLKDIGNNTLVIDELFHQYVLYIKLKRKIRVDRDVRSVRSFYLDHEVDNGKFLETHSKEIMEDLCILADMWHNLAKRIDFSYDILKWYHCLLKGKNNLWMWAVATYYLYLKHNNELTDDDVSKLFSKFMQCLTAGIYYTCLEFEGAPSDNVKQFVFKVINNIGNYKEPEKIFTFAEEIKKDIELEKALDNMACGTKGNNPTNDKPYVFIHAYLNPGQKDLLPLDTDIEHIYPKSWARQAKEAGTIAGLKEGGTDDENRQYVEYFGNKICLEKLNNIRCSDDYFTKKLEIYENGKDADSRNVRIDKSKIQDVIDFCSDNKERPTWGLNEIVYRNKLFRNIIISFFKNNLVFRKI